MGGGDPSVAQTNDGKFTSRDRNDIGIDGSSIDGSELSVMLRAV